MAQQRWARVAAGLIAETQLGDTAPAEGWQACADECGPTWKVLANGMLIPPRLAGAQHRMPPGQFRDLFTAVERIAMRAADARLADGELKAMSQEDVNIASVECAQLIGLAVALGVMTQPRADMVLAGQPPA